MKFFSYKGEMEFNDLSDSCIKANYQHDHVITTYKKFFEGKKVLDAGCWTGPLAKQFLLNEVPVDYTGIDINEDALHTARESFPQFSFEQCRLDSLSEEFLDKYKNRACHEWKNGEMKRFHGLDRAKGYGLRSMGMQARLTALAVNLKRIAKLVSSLNPKILSFSNGINQFIQKSILFYLAVT